MIGAGRTAEELGRAFPQVPVVTSRGGAALEQVAAARALVVATPGVEPVAEGGYGAALLLDGWALLNRPDLRANEEALRRWMNAAALVRPAGEGGRVVVAADSALSVVQALLRWDPAWRGERELTERVEVGFPPAVRMAKLVGVSSALAELVAAAQLPASVELLGPVPVEEHDVEVEREQLLIRVPRQDGLALARALRGAVVARAVRKAADQVRIQLDPHELT